MAEAYASSKTSAASLENALTEGKVVKEPPLPPPLLGLSSPASAPSPPPHGYARQHGGRQKVCQKELQFLLVGAIEEQRLDTMRCLVAQGVNLDCTILYSKTPLTHAIELTFVEIAKLLITSGANVNKPELLAYARRPLHLALNIHAHDLMMFLIQHGAEVDGRDGCGVTPLHQACFIGDTDAVEILLSAGASIKVGDSVGRTAFHRAVEGQHLKLAKYLLACGADVNEHDNFRWTPLFQSIIFCDVFGVKFLITHGADVNFVDHKGDTPVHIACDRLSRNSVYVILSTSLDFYKRVKKIPTPALQSLLLGERDCSQCELRIIRELVNAGANVSCVPLRPILMRQINNIQRLLPLFRFLILSGMKAQSEDEDIIALQSSPPFSDFCTWFREQVEKQTSLQRNCRKVVRSYIGTHHRDIEQCVRLLPLPEKVKEFLNLADFWQAGTHEVFGSYGVCCMSAYH